MYYATRGGYINDLIKKSKYYECTKEILELAPGQDHHR